MMEKSYRDSSKNIPLISSGSERDLIRTSKLLNDMGSFFTQLIQTFRNSKVEISPKKKILKRVIETLDGTSKQIDVILNFIYDKETLREGRRLSFDMRRLADELTYYKDMKDSEFKDNKDVLKEILDLFGDINFRSSDFGDSIKYLTQKNKYRYSSREY